MVRVLLQQGLEHVAGQDLAQVAQLRLAPALDTLRALAAREYRTLTRPVHLSARSQPAPSLVRPVEFGVQGRRGGDESEVGDWLSADIRPR